MRKLAVSMFLALAAGAAGCSRSVGPATENRGSSPYSGAYPIRAVATTGMVADLVQRVGGSHVAVEQLMGPGVDPHLYKASTGDIARLDGADAIFYSGWHLEGKLTEVFEQLRSSKPTQAVTEKIPVERIIRVADGTYDPHLWFDVSLWSEAVDVVRDELSAFDPPHAADYARHAAEYRKELAELDAYCRERLAVIPKDRRVLVTAHDAFHYLGRAYDIEVRGIQGVSTDSEAGVREINQLVDFIAQRKIKAIFAETSVSDRNVQALIEGCRAREHPIALGGQLYSDAMGAANTPEGTYPGMVRHNVETIVKALQ